MKATDSHSHLDENGNNVDEEGSSEDHSFLPDNVEHEEPLEPELPYTSIPQDQVDTVRKGLQPDFQDTTDEQTIRRFITATGGKLPEAIKRLNNTLTWRDMQNPEWTVCRACVKDPRSHYLHPVGFDKIGRPIIYSCLALAENREVDENKEHMVSTFESAVKLMPPGVTQWVWVCDFHGFKAADCNPKLAKLFLDMSADHYPERLGLFLVVGAPKIFKGLWKVISPFVDPKTYRKIRFVPHDTNPKKHPVCTLKVELEKHFDEATTQWLMREMEENRDKKVAKKKAFSYSATYKAAKTGELAPYVVMARTGQPMPAGSPHDVRGSPNLLAAYHQRPELMAPQALA